MKVSCLKKKIDTRIAHLGSLRRNVCGLLVDAQQLPRFAGHAHAVRENGVAGGHGGINLPHVVEFSGVAVHDSILGLERRNSEARTAHTTDSYKEGRRGRAGRREMLRAWRIRGGGALRMIHSHVRWLMPRK